jgi:hypothetical protein
MIQVAGSLMLLLSLLTGPAAPVAAAPAGARHSGSVVFIDAERGVLILDEVGPWRAGKGRALTTRLTIDLTMDTKVNTFIRINVPDHFAGEFIEVPLEAVDVTPGDVVTIDCRHEAGRLVAVTVTLAALD